MYSERQYGIHTGLESRTLIFQMAYQITCTISQRSMVLKNVVIFYLYLNLSNKPLLEYPPSKIPPPKDLKTGTWGGSY
jgi:hypothetical protein